MTASLLDRAPLEEITAQAQQIRPARTVLTWIGGLLFALGWVTYKTLAVAWFCGAWAFVAVREGWRDAAGSGVSRGPGRSHRG